MDASADNAARGTGSTTRVLALGAGLGVLGDILFYRAGIGLNAALWLPALALAGWYAHGRTQRPAGTLRALLGIGCFFAGCLAWRASPFLRFWDVAAVVAAAITVAVHFRRPLRSAQIAHYARGVADVGSDLTAGPVQAFAEAPWVRAGWESRRSAAIATGVALALPVVLVFGALLVAADPAMETFATALFDWNIETILTHLAILAATAWLATGWLRRVTIPPRQAAGRRAGTGPTLNAIALGIPLGALTLLLAIFIGIQARYLFGGATVVRFTGLTYAQLARRGFFELVTLCGLALPILLGAQRLVDRGAPAAVESFRALAPTFTALVGLVMVSALARMWLYVRLYGLTEDRFYATAFMGWLGAVLAWFVVTEFRGGLDRFASGAVAVGFLLLAALNAANPDAVIVRTNITRASAGVELDAAYLGDLSTDALPTLRAHWPALDNDARCAVQTILRHARARHTDWRAWTWSRWRADRAERGLATPDTPCPGPPSGGDPAAGRSANSPRR